MDKLNITPALFDYGEQLVKRVIPYDQELAIEFRVLLNMLKDNVPKSETTKLKTTVFNNAKGKKPVPLVKSIFKANPDRQYSPPEIRDKLQEFKIRGDLNSSSENLLSTAHSAIRVLERQGFVTKTLIPDSDPVYQLSEKEKGLLNQ